MKIFDVTITRYGYVQIKAETETEAIEIADSLKADEIHWSDDYEATDCREYDY